MTNPRQDQLLKFINDKGYCSNEELAKILNVSTQTIRRDIKKLGDEKLLIRHHGGASSLQTKANLDYEIRIVSKTEQKNAIARKIATLIPNNSTVFITIGTTTEIIARHLLEKRNLQVITNSLRVANVLHVNSSFDVSIPNGKIKASNGGIVGSEVLGFITNFRFDYYITSLASIDTDGTLLEYDFYESSISKAAMQAARNVIVAIDSSKFTPRGAVELGHLNTVDHLFTDDNLPQHLDAVAKKSGVNIHIC